MNKKRTFNQAGFGNQGGYGGGGGGRGFGGGKPPGGKPHNPFERPEDKYMIYSDGSYMARSTRIQQKNASKGQNSLSNFFGGGTQNRKDQSGAVQGIKSNKAAFDHYSISCPSYSDRKQVPKDGKENPTDGSAKSSPNPNLNPEDEDQEDVGKDEKFLTGYQKNMALQKQQYEGGAIKIKSSEPAPIEEDDGIDMSSLQIWSWNVNGIRAIVKKNRIQEFFEKAKPTILAIQESKIDEERMVAESLKDKFPSDYLQYWNCCKPPIKGYAGTTIFTKLKPINVTYDIGCPKHDREGRTITCEFERFFLVGVYVPNSGATLKWKDYRVNEWDLDFRAYLKGLERKGKPVILTGDLNVAHQDIDIYDPKRNESMACFTPQERQSFSNFTRMGFLDTFREIYPGKIKYSFWDIRDKSRKENKGWRLDYVMVSKYIMHACTDSDIHNEYWGSDHCPVSATFDINKIDLEDFKEKMKFEEENPAELEQVEIDEERKSELDMDDPVAFRNEDEDDSGAEGEASKTSKAEKETLGFDDIKDVGGSPLSSRPPSDVDNDYSDNYE